MAFEWVRVPIGRKWAKGRSQDVSSERLINGFLEKAQFDAKAPDPIYGRPGLIAAATGLNGPCRGRFRFQGQVYFVMGQRLYRFDATHTATEIGTILGSKPCTGGASETELGIVSEPYVYAYDGTTLVQVGDADLPAVTTGAYADGYLVVTYRDAEGQFAISNLRDFQNWDALDFNTATREAGALKRVFWNSTELFLFKDEITEIYFNSAAAAGGGEFPFERRSDVMLEHGLRSRWAITDSDNTLFFWATDGVFYRLNGYVPTRISNHDIESRFQDLNSPETVEAWTFDFNGHKFVFWANAEICMVFDVATGLWHEWQTTDKGSFTAKDFVYAYGYWYAGGRYDASIYRLDKNTYTDAGTTIILDAYTPPIHAFPDEMACARVELDMKTGVTQSGNTEAQLLERTSEDGGRTWTPAGWRQTGIGEVGEYNKKVSFNRLGQKDTFAFNFRITDDCERQINSAYALMERRRR